MVLKWEQEHQSGTKMGTKWNKAGPRAPKWDKNGNKVGANRKQEHQSETRMGTKWEYRGNKNAKVGQEWEQSWKNKVEIK